MKYDSGRWEKEFYEFKGLKDPGPQNPAQWFRIFKGFPSSENISDFHHSNYKVDSTNTVLLHEPGF